MLNFYTPPNLVEDFDNALQSVGQLCILNPDSATPLPFYAIVNDINFKSNMRGLSDNTDELTVSKNLIIKKGDYVLDFNETLYIINWTPFEDINSRRCQMQICTNIFNFIRWQDAEFDFDGNQTTPASYIDIATDVYGFFARNTMSAWKASDGQVGIIPTQRIFIGVQYNDVTRQLRITDKFKIKNSLFSIIDTDYTQLNIGGEDGVLMLHAMIMEADNIDSY